MTSHSEKKHTQKTAFTETYVTNMSVTWPLAGISQFATHTIRLVEREEGGDGGGGGGQGDYKLKEPISKRTKLQAVIQFRLREF